MSSLTLDAHVVELMVHGDSQRTHHIESSGRVPVLHIDAHCCGFVAIVLVRGYEY